MPPTRIKMMELLKVKNTSIKSKTVKRTPVTRKAVKSSLVKRKAVKDTLVRSKAVKNTSVKRKAVKSTHVKSKVVNTPVKSKTIKNISVKSKAVKNISVKSKTVNNSLVKNKAIKNSPVKSKAVKRPSVKRKVAKYMPADRKVVERPLVKRKSVERPSAKRKSENKVKEIASKMLKSECVVVKKESELSDDSVSLSDSSRTVVEFSDRNLNLNYLPREVIFQIFKHLGHNDLGRMGRVCKTWYEISRYPELWRKVDVKFHKSSKGVEYPNEIMLKFIKRLSAMTTHMQLDFWFTYHSFQYLNFEAFCRKLQNKCPFLQTLILKYLNVIRGDYSRDSVISLCEHYFKDLKVLIFQNCIFADPTFFLKEEEVKDHSMSKIEHLEIIECLILRN